MFGGLCRPHFKTVWSCIQWSNIFFKVMRQLIRQLVYIIFFTNNHASFHLWWEENLVKYQEVSNFYDYDCNDEIGRWWVITSKSQTRISWTISIGKDKFFLAPFLFPLKCLLPVRPPNRPLLVFFGGAALHIFLAVESWRLKTLAISL